jgi:hypothetical protein
MSEATMHRKIAFVGVGEAKLSAAAVRSALSRPPFDLRQSAVFWR